MPAPRPWTVLPHDPIRQLDSNLWTVEGNLPGAGNPVRRRMTVVKLSHGGLLIHNAVALEASAQKQLESFGEPTLLIVPNDGHRLDAHAYKERYPKLKVFCPAPGVKKVSEMVPVDGHYDTFPADPAVRVTVIDGLKNGEAVFEVFSKGGTSLVFNDVLFNMAHRGGFTGMVLRLLGSTGGLKMTPVARMLIVRDLNATKAHLQRLAAEANLKRLIVSHGDVLETDVGTTLARAVA